MSHTPTLTQEIKAEAKRLGFFLSGITTPAPPSGVAFYERWLAEDYHGGMGYLYTERARACRADPHLLLPECQSILVLGIPYNPNVHIEKNSGKTGRVASYAWGDDYHLVLSDKLVALTTIIEKKVGYAIPSCHYTDTGPILERELAQRAGLGWVGKNTCLINPRAGSYFLLAEILLGIKLDPDIPFASDLCGSCTRCIQACPTGCILPDRSIDSRRCISYLTIENKEEIPPELRSKIGNWIFGCDICQQVCPWNRFAKSGDPAFAARPNVPTPELVAELVLNPEEFNKKFKNNPIKRAKRRGYLRNVAVAMGNVTDSTSIPFLGKALQDPEPLVRQHAAWALEQLTRKGNQ